MKHTSCFYKIIDIFFHFLKPKKNYILFSAFRGQYSDNPKYISEELHFLRPDIKIFWVISSKRSNQNDIPSYVNVLKYDSLKFYYIKNKCGVLVDNGAGFYLSYNNSFIKRVFYKLLKNKKQFNLSTWHGNPIKHIGAQIPENINWNSKYFFTTSDCLIAGASFVKEVFELAFFNKIQVLLTGTPRNDILFRTNNEKTLLLKTKLGIPTNKKIVLYAPTFRNNYYDSGVAQIESIDFAKLFDTLQSKFGGQWVFVFRAHNVVMSKIDFEDLLKKSNGNIINGNLHDDMAEYLSVCDVLISDYSGCIFDVALTDKPCFLFAHDRKKYEENERGLYFPLEFFPYNFSNSFEELINSIKNFNIVDTKLRKREFLKKIGNIENGSSSRNVVNILLEKMH